MRRLAWLGLLLLACTAAPAEPEADPSRPVAAPQPTAPAEPPKPVEPPKPLSFEDRFGGIWVDIGKDVAVGPDGSYVIVGRSERVDDRYDDDYQLAAILLDARGEVLWQRYLGPQGNYQAGAGVAVDLEGMTLVGTTNGEGAGSDDAWVVRLDWAGETKWTKTLGSAANDHAQAVAPAPAGGWVVVGGTKSAQGRDAMVWRIGHEGEEFWSAKLGGSGDDAASAVVQWADGWVVAGSSNSPEIVTGGAKDGWIFALDSRGTQVWSQSHGAPHDDMFMDLVALEGGGWLAVGESDHHVYLVWVDAQGRHVATKVEVPGAALGVVASAEGGWAVGGIRDEGLAEAWLGWYGADHRLLRERKFGFDRNSVQSLAATPDGGWILTGNWATVNSNYGNIWACKLDARGEGC